MATPPAGTISQTIELAGLTLRSQFARVGSGQFSCGTFDDDGLPSLSAGFAGQLTTRTSDSAGVVTFPASPAHNFVNGNVVGVFWADADGNMVHRVGLAVSASDSLTITISGGAGSALPSASTAVVVSHAVSLTAERFDGTALLMLVVIADQPGVAVLSNDESTVLATLAIDAANEAFTWTYGTGASTPVDGIVADVRCYNAGTVIGVMQIAGLLKSVGE